MEFKILLNEENRRLDSFLRKKFAKTNLSLIYKLIRTHKVKINNVTILDPKIKVRLGDIISVNTENIQLISAEKPKINLQWKEIKEFEIIFENSDILIINKPPFTSVHGFNNCLDNLVKDFLIKRDGNPNIYATHIHRLDKDTTGCIVYAKNLATATLLLEHLTDIKKIYLCITSKPFLQKNFIQEGYIRYTDKKVSPGTKEDGKQFKQKFQFSQQISNKLFLQKIYLLTGRKHQIRYGCSLLNNPVVGEKLYLKDDAPKPNTKFLYLHAYGIVFSTLLCEKLGLSTSYYIAPFPKYWEDLFKVNNFKFQNIQLI